VIEHQDQEQGRWGARAVAWACAAALALALAGPAHALEPQYRRVTLVDGRVISAEILATESEGLRMRVPAGETLISFELLLDMVPISQAEYDAQAPWIVYFSVPPELEQDVVELLQSVEGIVPQPVKVAANGIEAHMAAKASDCEDINCIVGALEGAQTWIWVVMASPAPTGGTKIESKLSTSPDPPLELVVDSKSRNEMWGALHEAIGLLPPGGSAPKGPGDEPNPNGRSPQAFDERKVVALSFVPVPGLPSLAQKDTGGFALAMGVVVPSTVVWVGAVGQLGNSAPEFGALSFAGYYAVTVFANQVAGMRSLEKRRIGVTAAPTEAGGTAVVVGGGF
jgi:hypothetical protein